MKVAVIDDSREDSNRIREYLEQFQKETGRIFQIMIYNSSLDFLEEYQGEYDVIFLDIEMPGCSGLEVAKEIRDKDKAVGIIFVTSMAQYAIEGYEVNAIDFIVKPVGYFNFSMKLENAFRFFEQHKEKNILVNSRDGILRMTVSDLVYIEKERDFLVFYTRNETIKERGSIKAIKEKLADLFFSECTSGCLINLNYVKRIGKDTVTLMTGTELPLSRRSKKQFTEDYINFMGGM